MMRRIFFLLLSTNSFAFYRFQSYVIKGKLQEGGLGAIGQPIRLKNQNTLIMYDKFNYLEIDTKQSIINLKGLDVYPITTLDIPILFEPITGSYFITSPQIYSRRVNGAFYREIRKNNEDPIYDFLRCKFKYDSEEFWKLNNLIKYESFTSGRTLGPLMFLQNQDDLLALNNIDGHILTNFEEIIETQIRGYNTFYSSETAKRYPLSEGNSEIHIEKLHQVVSDRTELITLRLQRKITVADNTVDVINEKDGVKLYKKDQNRKVVAEVDLKQALLNYYNSDRIQSEFVQRLTQDLQKNRGLGKDTAFWTATQSFHPTLKPEAYDLLIGSKILAVWNVRGEEFNPKRYFYQEERDESYYFKRPVYSVMTGLAYNEKDGYFHWVTDLGRDIEVLFLPKEEAKTNKRKRGSVVTRPGVRKMKI